MFEWTRTPDPAWQAMIDSAFPPAANGSGLTLRWQPGSTDSPVQRWVVYQMIPQDQCFVMDPVDGRLPIPAMAQYLVAIARLRQADDPLPHWLQTMHDTLQLTGCLAVPFWIVQGTGGGHRVTYGRVEQAWSQFTTGQLEPPYPGALPYADPDVRLVRAMVASDRWRGQWATVLAESNGRMEQAEREIRRRMQAESAASMGELVDEVGAGLVDADIPRVETRVDYREQLDRYVETGEVVAGNTHLAGTGSVAATTRG